ncbi:Hypothetical predicted protein, partial [Olea europaea subsp. europaea]
NKSESSKRAKINIITTTIKHTTTKINSELRFPQIAIGIAERGDGDRPKEMGGDAVFTAALPPHAGAGIGASFPHLPTLKSASRREDEDS